MPTHDPSGPSPTAPGAPADSPSPGARAGAEPAGAPAAPGGARDEVAPPGGAEPEPVEGGPSRARPRKERVLHTRIPAVLEEELKAAADALRVPVSNLVRTILEDAVAIADRATGRVEQGLERAARTMRDERERMRARVERASALEGVLAWQPVRLAQPTRCASCAESIDAGAPAALGITERPGPKLFVCRACVPNPGTKSESQNREE